MSRRIECPKCGSLNKAGTVCACAGGDGSSFRFEVEWDAAKAEGVMDVADGTANIAEVVASLMPRISDDKPEMLRSKWITVRVFVCKSNAQVRDAAPHNNATTEG